MSDILDDNEDYQEDAEQVDDELLDDEQDIEDDLPHGRQQDFYV